MAPVEDDEPSYFWHAFTNQYNLIGLATALGFAILSGSALPLILAAGVELIFLPSLAGNPRFQNVVKGQLLMGAHPVETFRRVLDGMVGK